MKRSSLVASRLREPSTAHAGLLALIAALCVSGFVQRTQGEPQHALDEQSIGHAKAALRVAEPEARAFEPVGNEHRWRQAEVEVFIDPSLEDLGVGAEAAVRGAFGTWLRANSALPRVRFTRGTEAHPGVPDGRSTVLVAPIDLPGHERDLAVTLNYSDPSTGRIVESDIVLNAKYMFQVMDSRAAAAHGAEPTERSASCLVGQQRDGCSAELYDVQNVMTHEVGHFFGLPEELGNASATMFLCTDRCETRKRVLDESDRRSICALYPLSNTAVGPHLAADTLGRVDSVEVASAIAH